MDFETSCWSTGPLTNGVQTIYNCDNSVQRRPKIDYFDSSTITPIVSHISSNGYYGYCPTTNVPSSADTRSPINQKDTTDIDINVSDSIIPMELTNSEQSQYQGRSMFYSRKRAVQSVADEFAEQDAKRQRRSHLSVIDYVEDIQMGYDDDKDVTINPPNIASKKLPIEKFFVCINERIIPLNKIKLDQSVDMKHQIESKAKFNGSEANAAAKKTDDNHLTQAKESITNDMENMYWHTHGSLLWQR